MFQVSPLSLSLFLSAHDDLGMNYIIPIRTETKNFSKFAVTLRY